MTQAADDNLVARRVATRQVMRSLIVGDLRYTEQLQLIIRGAHLRERHEESALSLTATSTLDARVRLHCATLVLIAMLGLASSQRSRLLSAGTCILHLTGCAAAGLTLRLTALLLLLFLYLRIVARNAL